MINIGYPLVLLVVINRGINNDKLKDVKFRRRYGGLYMVRWVQYISFSCLNMHRRFLKGIVFAGSLLMNSERLSWQPSLYTFLAIWANWYYLFALFSPCSCIFMYSSSLTEARRWMLLKHFHCYLSFILPLSCWQYQVTLPRLLRLSKLAYSFLWRLVCSLKTVQSVDLCINTLQATSLLPMRNRKASCRNTQRPNHLLQSNVKAQPWISIRLTQVHRTLRLHLGHGTIRMTTFKHPFFYHVVRQMFFLTKK